MSIDSNNVKIKLDNGETIPTKFSLAEFLQHYFMVDWKSHSTSDVRKRFSLDKYSMLHKHIPNTRQFLEQASEKVADNGNYRGPGRSFHPVLPSKGVTYVDVSQCNSFEHAVNSFFNEGILYSKEVNVAKPSGAGVEAKVEALEDRIAVLEDQLDTVLKFLVTKEG